MGIRIVALRGGDYDVWRRDELRRELDAIQGADDLAIDMHRVTFMDAGAVGLLLSMRGRLAKSNPDIQVHLLNVPSIVRRILTISRADELFELAP